MKRGRFRKKLCLFILIAVLVAVWSVWRNTTSETRSTEADYGNILDYIENLWKQEPEEVQELRTREVAEYDAGYQEYYFRLLTDEEKRIYREMLVGIRERQEDFYLSVSDEDTINRVYHALLKDHSELFWVQNREQVYTTSYPDTDYCKFSPGYSYTEEEIQEIQTAADQAWQEVSAMAAETTDTYEIVKDVYTYLIDNTEYISSDDDQNIAGTFWRKQAVCAGYARAAQYLLEKLNIPVIYVEGSTASSSEGHAWDIVEIDGQYYYMDPTNGDQPQFLEGDAVQLAEHKTIIYDYLCPFPWEYEQIYTASDEFEVPQCTATDKNFYVMNQACFDAYDYQDIYDLCRLRLDNGAAVIRFKFSSQEAFDQAYQEWIQDSGVEAAARYYLEIYGKNTIQYHYGILDNLKTIYFMF